MKKKKPAVAEAMAWRRKLNRNKIPASAGMTRGREGQALLRWKATEGQVMFLTVVILGAIVTTVTVVGGLLMSYQIRRSADVAASARAVFAADAGVECMLYNLFAEGEWWEAENDCGEKDVSEIGLDNEAKFWVKVVSRHDSIVADDGTKFPKVFIATGQYRNSIRSIELNLSLGS